MLRPITFRYPLYLLDEIEIRDTRLYNMNKKFILYRLKMGANILLVKTEISIRSLSMSSEKTYEDDLTDSPIMDSYKAEFYGDLYNLNDHIISAYKPKSKYVLANSIYKDNWLIVENDLHTFYVDDFI